MESSATINTTASGFNHADYAGFWVRFFAACIDMIVYTPIYYGIMYVCGDANRWLGETIFFLVALITYAMFFASRIQASPGMYLLTFHVCNTEGKRMSFKHAIVWGIVGSIGWIICFAGVLYMQSRFDIYAVNDLLRSCSEQNIAMDDCVKEIESLINIPFSTFMHILYCSIGLAFFLSFIWALSIGMAKDKTGFNNLICHTRFIRGRAA